MIRNLKWLMTHPLGRKTPTRTVARWLWWQIRQRFTAQPFLMPWVNGTRLEIIPHGGLTGYLYVGLPDFDEQTFFLRVLRRGDRFLDVGANAGAFSVLALSCGCQVTAFEPVPETFAKLRRNADLNSGTGNIDCRQSAIGSKPGSLRLTSDADTGNRVLRDGESRAFVEVPALTLDSEFAERLDCACFIKVDVEGFEWEVIQGATRLLENQNVKAILLETFRPHNFRTEKLKSIESRLQEHGFVPCEFNVQENRLQPLLNPQDGGNNTLYVRDLKWIETRLASRDQ